MTRPPHASLTPSVLAVSALLAFGLLPDGPASGTALEWREALRNDLPNRADVERMERGYYEHLLDASRSRSKGQSAEGPAAGNERLTLKVDDVREFVLKPGQARDLAAGVPWATNALGMRDRDYPRLKPPATFRVALAGDSIGAGWGVDDGEGFEPRLEARWDARSRAAGGPAVEVLNFAVPGHGPGQRWTQFATLGWSFDPDFVIYEATPADAGWDERRLRSTLTRGVGFDAPVYRDVLASAGVKPGLDAEGYRRALKPLRWEILAGVYRRAADECRARGVPSAWVLVPRVGKLVDGDDRRKLLDVARRAGFDAVIDATGAYDGENPRALSISPRDFHPNADGHARLARAFDDALRVFPALAKLWARPDRDGGVEAVGFERHDRVPNRDRRQAQGQGVAPR